VRCKIVDYRNLIDKIIPKVEFAMHWAFPKMVKAPIITNTYDSDWKDYKKKILRERKT